MKPIIDYVVFVFEYLVEMMKTIKLPGSLSLLDYMLISLILIVVFKVIKGSGGEVNRFFDSSLTSFKQQKYKKDISEQRRKQQIINEKKEG